MASFIARAVLPVLLPALLAALPYSAHAEQLRGKVVAVADGDTITLLDEQRQQHRIRLDGIDAPERSQPFGQRARQSLAGLAHGREAVAECPKTDKYGRSVCRVTVDGIDVGLEQVRRGLAWHYVRYAREQTPEARVEYARAEQQARGERSGLWSYRDPTPPWDYRRAARTADRDPS
ncbi:MAG: thermonuclease family protein [Burkholderiaceae bacterium]